MSERPERRWFWAAFALAVVACWLALLAMGHGPAGSEAQPPAVLWSMWMLMAVAMMGPVAMPYLATYRRLGAACGRQPSQAATLALAGGYLAVWLVYAVLAAGLQSQLQAGGLVDGTGLLRSPWLAALLLALAALWQWTAWKRACLLRCREPWRFFLAEWRDGVAGGFRMGVRQGLVCAACCWALMLLAFVGGAMNVLWMAALTVLMLAERWPGSGERLRRGLGAGLAAGALAVVLVFQD